MNWQEYMDQKAGKGTSSHKIAAAMGDKTSPASVNRWRKGVRPEANKVASFSRAYGDNPLVGLIIAGYVTEEEISSYPLAVRPTEELLEELQALVVLHAQGSALAGDLAARIQREIARRTETPPAHQVRAHEPPAEPDVNETSN